MHHHYEPTTTHRLNRRPTLTEPIRSLNKSNSTNTTTPNASTHTVPTTQHNIPQRQCPPLSPQPTQKTSPLQPYNNTNPPTRPKHQHNRTIILHILPQYTRQPTTRQPQLNQQRPLRKHPAHKIQPTPQTHISNNQARQQRHKLMLNRPTIKNPQPAQPPHKQNQTTRKTPKSQPPTHQ